MNELQQTPRTTNSRRIPAKRRVLISGAVALTLVAAGAATPALARTFTPPAAPKTCTLQQLRITPDRTTAIPGATYSALRYTNISRTRCTLQGYPTLRFRSATGQTLVTATPKGQATQALVTLAPRTAAFSVYIKMVISPTACRPASAASVAVHPPVSGSRSATTVIHLADSVCTAPGAGPTTTPITTRPYLPSLDRR